MNTPAMPIQPSPSSNVVNVVALIQAALGIWQQVAALTPITADDQLSAEAQAALTAIQNTLALADTKENQEKLRFVPKW